MARGSVGAYQVGGSYFYETAEALEWHTTHGICLGFPMYEVQAAGCLNCTTDFTLFAMPIIIIHFSSGFFMVWWSQINGCTPCGHQLISITIVEPSLASTKPLNYIKSSQTRNANTRLWVTHSLFYGVHPCWRAWKTHNECAHSTKLRSWAGCFDESSTFLLRWCKLLSYLEAGLMNEIFLLNHWW